MNDLNKKNSSAPVILVILLLLVLGAGGYFYSKNKSVEAPAPTTAETATPEETTAQKPDTTAPTTEEKPAIVEATKKLDIPPVTPPPPSSMSNDPKIVAMMGARTLGKATAPVKIIEYASLTCPHCGAFHRETLPKFEKEFVDTGRVQITFKEFPLNQPALDASQILRCMPSDKYISFMNLLFQEQEKWAYATSYKDFLRQNAKLAGMSDKTFDDCLANNALKEAIIGDMKAAGDQYKVESTPSFVINGGPKVLVGNQPIEEFEKAITEVTSTAPASAPASTPAPAAAPQMETPAESAADAATKASKPADEKSPDTTPEE